jgi:hypothetical protein
MASELALPFSEVPYHNTYVRFWSLADLNAGWSGVDNYPDAERAFASILRDVRAH